MAKLLYSAITSLDGYVADGDGNFGWAQPDAEVHSFVNELERPTGTYLLGRRMYEVLRYWDAPPDLAEQEPYIREFAEIWQDSDKIVYSSSLEAATSARTRVERSFDAPAVSRMKETAKADLSVGGPTLAAEALRAGLVDELHQFLNPVVVGGGTTWLPPGLHLELELLDERRFKAGVVHLHYRTKA
jgi:dihydrofolate reductase